MMVFQTKPLKKFFLFWISESIELSILLSSKICGFAWEKNLRGNTCHNAFISEELLLWYSYSVIVSLHGKSVEDLMIHKSWGGMIRTERLIEPWLFLWIFGFTRLFVLNNGWEANNKREWHNIQTVSLGWPDELKMWSVGFLIDFS